jgi:uroporphyrin-III C-methyltransferase
MTAPKPDHADHDQAMPIASAEPDPPAAPDPVPAAPARSSGGRGLASLALLVALGAGGGSGYLWYLWRQDQAHQASRLDQALKQALAQPNPELQALQSQMQQMQALKTALDEVRAENQAIKGQVLGLTGDIQPLKNAMTLHNGENDIIKGEINLLREALEAHKTSVQKQHTELGAQWQEHQDRLARQTEQINNLQLSHNGLAEHLETVKTVAAKGGDVNAFVLAEVEYLLRLADAKLKLERNLPTARLALDVAQQRLKAVNESAMAPVQAMLTEAIASLRGVQLPDLTALSHKILQMESEVADLPLRINSEVPDIRNRVKPTTATISTDTSQPWWSRAGQTIWSQFKEIVIIRRGRGEAPPLIAVEEEFFLRQNLNLEMESMRMALLRGDAKAYQDANELVRKWTNTYFDVEDTRVATFINELNVLQTVQFNPYIPDLTGLNQAFRDLLTQRHPIRTVLKPPVVEQTPVNRAEAKP